MAQVLTISTSLGNATHGTRFSSGVSRVSTGFAADARPLEIGTTEEDIEIAADVVDAGWFWLKNCDATNFVQVGFATGSYFLRVPALCAMLVHLEPSVSHIFLKADTSACNVSFVVMEA